MACASVAAAYTADTKSTVPAEDSDPAVKRAWLLSEKWLCFDPVSQAWYEQKGLLEGKATLPGNPCEPSSSERLPLRKLEQKGFLPYVNSRGFQCLQRVTGQLLAHDPTTGDVKKPGADHPHVAADCVAECDKMYDEHPRLDSCAQCLSKFYKRPLHGYQADGKTPWVDNDEVACPAYAAVDNASAMAQGFKDAMQCQGCKAEMLVQHHKSKQQAALDPNADTDVQADLDVVWRCINGFAPTRGRPVQFYAGLALVAVGFVVYVVLLSVFLVRWKKSFMSVPESATSTRKSSVRTIQATVPEEEDYDEPTLPSDMDF